MSITMASRSRLPILLGLSLPHSHSSYVIATDLKSVPPNASAATEEGGLASLLGVVLLPLELLVVYLDAAKAEVFNF